MKKLLLLFIPIMLFLSSCKKDYAVERSILIDAPPEVVWQQIKYFKNWQNWSPWYAKDSSMNWGFSGTDGSVESAYTWTSEESGSGEMTNTGMTEGEELLYHTHFLEPWESETDGYLKITEMEGGTEVKWGFTGQLKGIASLFVNMEEMVGPDFEKGLSLLKEHAQAEAAKAPELKVETVELKEQDYVAVRALIDITGMQSFFAENFEKILSTDIDMLGHPTGLYYSWDMENMQSDMAVAIPVAAGTKAPKGTSLITLPAGLGVQVNFPGPYENIGTAHELLETYLLTNDLAFIGPAVEEYVIGKESESDPNKWQTKVIYYVK